MLNALFHQGVAVCEGDPDRAIYQTVATKSAAEDGGEAVLFIHTNGKDAIKSPLELLRDSGTRVCAIVDLDVLNSCATLTDIVTALTGSPPEAHILELRARIAHIVESKNEAILLEQLKLSTKAWLDEVPPDLRRARRSLKSIAEQTGRWSLVSKGGVECFDEAARGEVLELIGLLGQLGLFVVPSGDLESWIRLDVPKGRHWNREALRLIHQGECPLELQDFVKEAMTFLTAEYQAPRIGIAADRGLP